jgi:hypothetical protein
LGGVNSSGVEVVEVVRAAIIGVTTKTASTRQKDVIISGQQPDHV